MKKRLRHIGTGGCGSGLFGGPSRGCDLFLFPSCGRLTENNVNARPQNPHGSGGTSSFISDATGYAVQHLQYLPFGESFIDQQNGYDARYTFSGKEKDDETSYSYFGARYYDSDLSVWLSVDPMSDKNAHESPYVYVSDNPIIFIDGNGEDKVYFDYFGNEIYRVKSNKVFETYVQTGTKTVTMFNASLKFRIYEKAPMPGVMQGLEDPKFQQFDYQIAATVFIANQMLKRKQGLPHTEDHQFTGNSQTPTISPDLIKAMIMVESTVGEEGPNGTGDTDIMQSNYPEDWVGSIDVKIAVGLKKKQEMTPKTSIEAGVGILLLKGMSSDENGNYTTWKGDYEAVARYKTKGDYRYADKVFDYYRSMTKAKPENY